MAVQINQVTHINLKKMNIESHGVLHFLHHEAANGFPKGNFVCSPALIDAGLSIIASGSDGEVLKHLLDFLRAESLGALYLKSLRLKVTVPSNNVTTGKSDAGPKLYYDNAVWVDNNFSLEPSFIEVLQKIYGTQPKSVNFQNQVGRVIEDGNSWVSNASNNHIREMISRQAIRENTMFILTSALNFKAAWARGFEFSPMLTTNRNFYLLNGKTKLVPSMTMMFKDYDYGYFDGCQVLKIPFQEGGDRPRFSMYFILPDDKDGLPKLIHKFHSNTELFSKCFNLSKHSVLRLELPKFKLSCDLNVSDPLKKYYGLVRLFKPFGDIPGILTQSHQAKNMHVQDIVVKSCIEVDEKGAEAASAFLLLFMVILLFVSFSCYFTSRSSSRPLGVGGDAQVNIPSFIADHPFMFIIKEETSGAVLFVGSVLDP